VRDTNSFDSVFAQLKGEKPADLPVQQSTKVELPIEPSTELELLNVKTAAGQGLSADAPRRG
jgi:hypothetical protein